VYQNKHVDASPARIGPVSDPGLQATIAALASPIRREILWLLWDGERSAGDIAAAFEVTAGTISSHLNTLVRAGLVRRRADGTFRHYRLDREVMAAVRPLLAGSDERWQRADDLPERDLAEATTDRWVTVTTTVPMARADAFASFADEKRYSAFLGVPVTIRDGRFTAEMEWGTQVRGHYEVVAPPDLIAMRWDFADDETPVPGRQLVGYLRFSDEGEGCRVEVHQEAGDADQAEFLTAAWSMVLGRFTEHARGKASPARSRRPKHLP
jgi:DNA-binding transcriptional ArsR family regulator/uncharacterized protein YndB with AHSA1/START domain